jgi:hypothetical protein
MSERLFAQMPAQLLSTQREELAADSDTATSSRLEPPGHFVERLSACALFSETCSLVSSESATCTILNVDCSFDIVNLIASFHGDRAKLTHARRRGAVVPETRHSVRESKAMIDPTFCIFRGTSTTLAYR